jgi:hypothetical protein
MSPCSDQRKGGEEQRRKPAHAPADLSNISSDFFEGMRRCLTKGAFDSELNPTFFSEAS